MQVLRRLGGLSPPKPPRKLRLWVWVKLKVASWLYSCYSLADNYFRCIGSYVPTSNIDSGWSIAAPKPPALTSYWYFCRYIHFRSELCFRNSVYITTLPCSWPRDHGGRIKTGVGSVSRGAGTEPNSPDRSVRPMLRFGPESIFTTGNFGKRLLTYLEKNWADCRS